jgi:hypothetical protein
VNSLAISHDALLAVGRLPDSLTLFLTGNLRRRCG